MAPGSAASQHPGARRYAACWKCIVRRRLGGERRGSFPLAGSNWFEPARADERAWRSDVGVLAAMHAALRERVAGLEPRDLDRRAPGSQVTNLDMLTGIVAHDPYHAGQIALLKRLAWPGGDRSVPRGPRTRRLR